VSGSVSVSVGGWVFGWNVVVMGGYGDVRTNGREVRRQDAPTVLVKPGVQSTLTAQR
jgi:hypothetical protein